MHCIVSQHDIFPGCFATVHRRLSEISLFHDDNKIYKYRYICMFI